MSGAVLAVDIGGTFTDLVLLAGSSRRLHRLKRSSTPPDYAAGLIAGALRLCEEADVKPSAVRWILHGTTVGTNTLLERRGAVVGLLTTRGFRDVVEIGDQMRPRLYGLEQVRPLPLVPRHRRLEARERIGAGGRVVGRLDERSVRAAARAFRRSGAEAVALAFLFSHLDPRHERRAARLLSRALPGAGLSLSSEVSPEHGEIGRFQTTVVNAYLQPTMRRYLEGMTRRLRAAGFRAHLLVLQSNGGVMTAGRAARLPVRCLLSGPAAGVVGAPAAAGRGRDLITFDMGGTSTDVSLLPRGRAVLRTQRVVGELPVRTPSFDIETIGAGGGSIASVDPSGRLRVGPESAGADPGPAAYGRGGTDPTVTDALIVLGLIDPHCFLAGEMALDAGRARDAVRGKIARPLRMSVERAAHGIITLVNHHMARALRLVSVERGYDPRRFTLVAYGGAGPLHAAWLARQLGIPRIIVPPWPGLLSAAGLLQADLRYDGVAHLRARVTAGAAGGGKGDASGRAGAAADGAARAALTRRLGSLYRRLEGDCRRRLAADGFPARRARFTRSAELRYEGQAHEIAVPWEGGSRRGLTSLAARFHAAHRRAYGHDAPEEPVEVLAVRVAAEASIGRPTSAAARGRGTGRRRAARGRERRRVLLDPRRGFQRLPACRREDLRPGARLAGPALVQGGESVTLLLAGQRLRVLGDGALEVRT